MQKISRNIKGLYPELQVIIKKLVYECEKSGLAIKITDTIRNEKEQNDLYAIGRTKPGKIVTNAKYPFSPHNWGIAFDFCRNDGKGAYNDEDNFFYKVSKIAKKYKLVWGGDWKNFKDKPHLEMQKFMPDSTVKNLIQNYQTPEKFFESWYKVENDLQYFDREFKYNSLKKIYKIISKNGENYIKVKDIAKLLNKEIQFDMYTKITQFKDKFLNIIYQFDTKKQKFNVLNINNENYIKVKDILNFLGYNYKWIANDKKTIIIKK